MLMTLVKLQLRFNHRKKTLFYFLEEPIAPTLAILR